MEVKELDKDRCPFDEDYCDYIVCEDCPYRIELSDSFVTCSYSDEGV